MVTKRRNLLDVLHRSLQCLFILLDFANISHSQTHKDALRIFEDKLDKRNYNTEVRPVLNQTDIINVDVLFNLIAIKDVDDVRQSFECNGFLSLIWTDEIAAWNASDYGGLTLIHPKPKKIWRPRLALSNTLGDRDLFKDDYAPTLMFNTGTTMWYPGSLFATSCDLDMSKYPFDEQVCSIQLIGMGWTEYEVNFHSAVTDVNLYYFQPHDEWKLTSAIVVTETIASPFDDIPGVSNIMVIFHLKRRPGFLMLNIILPVVFLSFMNLLVFLIPEESGEKISYGITVLLAMSVYLSFISGLLPRSSDKLPWLNVYIFILLIISVLTVVDSIIIVYLHHLDEKETRHQRTKQGFKQALNKITHVRNAVNSMGMRSSGLRTASPWSTLQPAAAPSLAGSSPPGEDDQESEKGDKPSVNKYKIIGKYIDGVSLLVFSVIWLSVTLGFMIYIST